LLVAALKEGESAPADNDRPDNVASLDDDEALVQLNTRLLSCPCEVVIRTASPLASRLPDGTVIVTMWEEVVVEFTAL
jgi:hypothetical protein